MWYARPPIIKFVNTKKKQRDKRLTLIGSEDTFKKPKSMAQGSIINPIGLIKHSEESFQELLIVEYKENRVRLLQPGLVNLVGR